jgi:hypothetical protein
MCTSFASRFILAPMARQAHYFFKGFYVMIVQIELNVPLRVRWETNVPSLVLLF